MSKYTRRDTLTLGAATAAVAAAPQVVQAAPRSQAGLAAKEAASRQCRTMLTVSQAKRFFGSLYDHKNTPDLSGFESAAIRLVARIDTSAAPGDKALGLLMLNHVMSTPKLDNARKGALTAAILMNIKQNAVAGFMDAFPQENLDSLIEAASAAGYQVDVLSPRVANSMPRSVVGR